MTKFINYSGTKIKYRDKINPIINASTKNIYVEPFVGSGAILFGLEKEFDEYIINDIDPNIIRMYKSFKECTYNDYKDIVSQIGPLANDKDRYYLKRKYWNDNLWKTDTTEEGLYLHVIGSSVINSMLRFSKNGMNQGFGAREFIINESDFNKIQSRLKRTTIHSVSYTDLMNIDDAIYFLDPPYFSQDSSYAGFNKDDIKTFINTLDNIEYVYTDILNEYNNKIENKIFVREMRSTSPQVSGDKKRANNNMEYIFYNVPKYSQNTGTLLEFLKEK